MLAVFGLGGWELLLIAMVVGMMIGIPLIVVAIVLFVVNRRKTVPPVVSNQQGSGNQGRTI